ncbi:MAG: hypothetical protein KGS00_02190 [Alphaproteobacteria bacterium]|nr:hypothetical protein [Alphaproteobacteria bacterium]
MFPGIAQAAGAIAILLSVIVRSIRSGASWQAVDEGEATAEHLRDLTGILDLQRLREVFGPPRLQDGVFPVSRQDVMRNRSGLGYLLGDRWLDGASALIAILALFPLWPLWGTRAWLDTLLLLAGAYQVGGWVASMRFIRTS